jgi:hypothetical protein
LYNIIRLFNLLPFPNAITQRRKCPFISISGVLSVTRTLPEVFSSKLVAVSAPIIFHRLDIIYFFITHNESKTPLQATGDQTCSAAEQLGI